MQASVLRWLLLLGPSTATLSAAARNAVAPGSLSQAALAIAVAVLIVGWLANRDVPVLSLVGAMASAFLLAIGAMVVLDAIPPAGEDVMLWSLSWIVLPGAYGLGLVAAFIGFIGLIHLGPLAR